MGPNADELCVLSNSVFVFKCYRPIIFIEKQLLFLSFYLCLIALPLFELTQLVQRICNKPFYNSRYCVYWLNSWIWTKNKSKMTTANNILYGGPDVPFLHNDAKSLGEMILRQFNENSMNVCFVGTITTHQLLSLCFYHMDTTSTGKRSFRTNYDCGRASFTEHSTCEKSSIRWCCGWGCHWIVQWKQSRISCYSVRCISSWSYGSTFKYYIHRRYIFILKKQLTRTFEVKKMEIVEQSHLRLDVLIERFFLNSKKSR